MPRGETKSEDGKVLRRVGLSGERVLPTAESGLECPVHPHLTVPEPKSPRVGAHMSPGHGDPSEGWSQELTAGQRLLLFNQ